MNNRNGALSFDAYIGDTDFNRTIQSMNRKLEGLTSKTLEESRKMESAFSNLGRLAAGGLAAAGLSQLPAQIVKVRGEFQQLEISFNTMLGSKAKADKLLADVTKFAAQTPYGLKETASATKLLLAYGASADSAVETLRRLGDVAAGIGAPLGDIAYLYGTTMVQGRLYTQDLNQFLGRGIPLIGELAKILKVADDEVKGMVEAGKVGFPEVQKAFENLTKSGSMFGGLMEAQSKSLVGLQAQLGDAVDAMFNDIGRSQEGLLSETFKGAISVVENYEKVIDVLKVVAAAYGTYRAAIMLTAAVQSASIILGEAQAFFALARSIKTAADAQALLNIAVRANPYVLAATALAGLVTAFVVFGDEATEAEKLQTRMNEAMKKSEDAAASEQAKIQVLSAQIQDETKSRDERNKKLKELVAISPDHLNALTLENFATAEGTKLIGDYIEAKKRQIELKEIEAELERSITNQNKARRGENDLSFWDRLSLSAAASAGDLNYSKSSASERKRLNDQIVKDEDAVQAKLRERVKALSGVDAATNKSAENTSKAVRKTVGDYNDEIKALKDNQEKTGTRAEFDAIEKQIKSLEAARDRITGGKVAEKDKPQPFGSIAYWDQVAMKAQEAIDKLDPKKDAAAIAKQQQLLNEATLKAEQARLLVMPYGTLEYWNQVHKIAQDILSRTPETDLAGIEKQKNVIASAQEKADDIRKKLAVRNFDEELEYKRGQYELYERWVLNMGQETAQKQFSSLVQGGKSYADYLESEIRKLESQAAGTDLMGTIGAGTDLQRLEKLKEALSIAKGEISPMEQFTRQLDAARDSSESLTDELIKVKAIQAELDPSDNSATGIAKRQAAAEREVEIIKERKYLLQDFLTSVAGSEQRQTAIQKKYADMRAALDKASNDKKAAGYIKALERINDAEKKELEDFSTESIIESKGYKELEKALALTKRNDTGRRLALLKQELSQLTAGTDEYLQKLQQVKDAEDDHRRRVAETWGAIAGMIGDIGSSLEGYDGAIGEIGNSLSGLASGVSKLSSAFANMDNYTNTNGKMSMEGYVAAAQNVIQIITSIIDAQKRRREAEKQFAVERIGFENEYSLALIKKQREDYGNNPFYTDYEGKIKAGVEAYKAAFDKYQDAIDKLEEGRAKERQKNVVDGKTVLGSAGAGAAAGAVIGSIVGVGVLSVPAAAVGAVVGGVIGAIGGLFAKKKKDVFGSLMEQYPELVTETANGWAELNVEMAQALITNNQVDDKTKEMLQNAIALNEELQNAKDQVRDVAVELTGQLGDNLRDALVEAFKAGNTAANALRKTVGSLIADVASKLLFSKMLGPVFDRLIDDMTNAIAEEGSPVSALDKFGQYGLPAVESYFQGLDYLDKWLKDKGYDSIRGETAQSQAMQGVIKGVSEETVSVLIGQTNAIRIYQAQMAFDVRSSLLVLAQISQNTSYNRYLIRLDDVVDRLERLNQTSMRGFGFN